MTKANFEREILVKTGDKCESQGCSGEIIKKLVFYIVGRASVDRVYCNRCNRDVNQEKYFM